MTPTVVVVSFWRNDAARYLDRRCGHLLEKRAPEGVRLRWLWVEGDSGDRTPELLDRTAEDMNAHGWAIMVLHHLSGIVGDDTPSRRRRGAATATFAFHHLPEDAHWVLLHESDLQTPVDVVGRLLKHPPPGRPGDAMAIAGWPTLGAGPDAPFYDIWAYRRLGGDHHGYPFDSHEYRPKERFEVASFGSCWLAPAALVRNRTLGEDCVVDLCRQWKAEGVRLWVDPSVPVIQPVELWTPTAFS